MWAAFRTGSAERRWAGRCEHRLTAHYIGRVSRRQAASTPSTFPPTNPRIRLLSVTTIAHCASISGRKCEHLRFSTLLLTAFARAHTALCATSGIGSTSYADSRCFSAAKAQCLTSYRATPMASRHTLLRFNRLMLHSRSLQARCSRCARGCRRAKPTRSPALCSSHALLLTAH